MPANLTTLQTVLKEYWIEPFAEQLNNQILLLKRLETTNNNLYGRYALVPLHTGRTGGVGAAAEGGTLPTPGNQGWAQAKYDLKYLYGRLRVTGPSMERTDSKEGSVVAALKSEMDGLMTDLKKDVARQIYGTGDGVITGVATQGAVTTYVLSGTLFNEAIRKGQLYVGMAVDIGTLAAPTVITGNNIITGITPATPSITLTTLTAAGSVNGTHFVSRAGNNTTGSVTYEISGLQQAVSTAANTFGAIDASLAANSYWDNQRVNVAGNLTLDTMTQGFGLVNGIAGGEVSCVIGSFGMQRAFFNLLQSQVRYTEPLKIVGGFQTLEYMGKPFIADLEAPYGKIYFLDERWIKVFANRDWNWADDDGRVLKWTSGTDQWEAIMRRYLQLGVTRRNTQLVLTGITVGGAADPGY